MEGNFYRPNVVRPKFGGYGRVLVYFKRVQCLAKNSFSHASQLLVLVASTGFILLRLQAEL